ncbi:hypothetical protein BOSEA31B_20498 [Hyphomicrobiales bacterium]|nr:hypothetical protein BOSEA31B_20498 [Hyphomicrobiales bacterium]CAH1703010.1 hypothetical protein BOSEA1005_30882 [Hyphomicrobiales bacterium]CAI0346332.1 hypothetical protein BO1005MUT1_500009 [Hyphomicrobiales bacterium]
MRLDRGAVLNQPKRLSWRRFYNDSWGN